MRVRVNQESFKLNVTHEILAYADVVHILGGSVHSIKKNTEALIFAGKQICLEVNAEKPSTLQCLDIRILDKITI